MIDEGATRLKTKMAARAPQITQERNVTYYNGERIELHGATPSISHSYTEGRRDSHAEMPNKTAHIVHDFVNL
jgi:hypothetical protein